MFAAGYQAACRHAFPGRDYGSWVAYAASEDRKGDPPLPAVAIAGEASGGTLNGYKTWIAAARSVTDLIVKVGTGEAARYFHIQRQSPGLDIDPGTPASFLADLSQGRAHFDSAPITAAHQLHDHLVRQFALLEPLYVYAAFCGFVLGGTTEHDLVTCAHDCLDGVEPALASIDADDLDLRNLQKADARAQDLLVRLSGNRIDAAGDWDSDQRLVAMYSKGIRRRVAAEAGGA